MTLLEWLWGGNGSVIVHVEHADGRREWLSWTYGKAVDTFGKTFDPHHFPCDGHRAYRGPIGGNRTMNSQAVRDAIQAGFTHVVTFGGPMPIQDWKPYGRLPEECESVTFHFDGDAIREEVIPKPWNNYPGSDRFVLCRWPLSR